MDPAASTWKNSRFSHCFSLDGSIIGHTIVAAFSVCPALTCFILKWLWCLNNSHSLLSGLNLGCISQLPKARSVCNTEQAGFSNTCTVGQVAFNIWACEIFGELALSTRRAFSKKISALPCISTRSYRNNECSQVKSSSSYVVNQD